MGKNKEMTLLECADNFQTLRTIIKTTIKTDLKKKSNKAIRWEKAVFKSMGSGVDSSGFAM